MLPCTPPLCGGSDLDRSPSSPVRRVLTALSLFVCGERRSGARMKSIVDTRQAAKPNYGEQCAPGAYGERCALGTLGQRDAIDFSGCPSRGTRNLTRGRFDNFAEFFQINIATGNNRDDWAGT